MKKLSFLFVALLTAAVIGSCGGKQAGDADADDSARIADSLAELERRDSALWAGFTSKDLTFFGLHGHVRALVADAVSYEFDTLGNWTRIGDQSPYGRELSFDELYPVYQHDKNGFITEASYWEGGIDYVWKDGRIVGENSYDCAYLCRLSYEYDSLGNISAATMVESEDDGDRWSKPSRIEYEYKDFDALRNWTLRKSNNGTEHRFITYYDRPGTDDNGSGEFAPWQKAYIFSGTIGSERGCPVAIGPSGGFYAVMDGLRSTTVLDYDKKSGRLQIEARHIESEKLLGAFSGTVSADGKGGFRYKGTFTNAKGGSVGFDLRSL